MLKRTADFLVSLKTAIWALSIVIFLFFAGSLIVPDNMEHLSDINDVLLFQWLFGSKPSVSWWIYALLAALTFTALNIMVCGADSLIKKLSPRRFLQSISPQVIHLGVLLFLFAHLLTASTGLREEVLLKEGGTARFSNGSGFHVEKVMAEYTSPTETFWAVRGRWLNAPGKEEPAVIMPAKPAFHNGLWLFIKSADPDTRKVSLMLREDIGALWALAGVAVFTLGCVLFLSGRPWKTEKP